jgi:hypothetical protein
MVLLLVRRVEILPREAEALEAGDGRSTDARLGLGWAGRRVALPAREAGLTVGAGYLERPRCAAGWAASQGRGAWGRGAGLEPGGLDRPVGEAPTVVVHEGVRRRSTSCSWRTRSVTLRYARSRFLSACCCSL